MKKRLLAVLSVILTFTMLGGPLSFAASGDQFNDVDPNGWYKPDVDYVAENNYMIGTSDTTFEPQSNLTRAMFATILARYDGAAVDNSKATIFTDVEVNQWFTGSIGWANDKKIVEGRGNNIFDPTAFITREELAVMVERYITYVESTTDKVHVTPGVAIPFTDADQISPFAKDAMDKAVIHGLIIGYPDKSVKPRQNITRAETAAVIHRIKWKTRDGRESYQLTYKDKDGNVISTVEAPVGQLVEIGKDIPNPEAPEGMTFVGWQYTAPDGTVTTYHPGDKIQLSDDMVLVPIFSDGKESHVVTRIDAVDNTELGKDTVKTGDTYKVPEGPAKSGYTFVEWNTSKDRKGTAYKPGSSIEVPTDMTLYAIYSKNSSGGPSVTTEKYQVKAELKLSDRKQLNGGTLEDKSLELLTPVYTVSSNGTGDQNIATVMEDLVNNDDGAIDALVGEFYNDLTAVHKKDVTVGGDKYHVEINADKKVTATKNGVAVNDWDAQLKAEQALYEKRMADIAAEAKVTGNTNWDTFVTAFAPTTLFTADGASLSFKDQSVYTDSFKSGFKAAGLVMNDLGDQFDDAWNAVIKFLTDPSGMAVEPGTFTLDQAKLATAFDKNGTNKDGILKELGYGYQILSAEETLSQDDANLLSLINKRISRAWEKDPSNVSAIVAFLRANGIDQDSKFFGKYSMKITIEKAS